MLIHRPDSFTVPPQGSFVNLTADTVLVKEASTVIKPTGAMLLRYLPDVIPYRLLEQARRTFGPMTLSSTNRGAAAGLIDPADYPGALVRGSRYWPRRADGTISDTAYSREVQSGIVGFEDARARTPFCRMTALTLRHYPEVEAAMPFIQHVDRLFAAHAPAAYLRQRDIAEHSHPDFVFTDTCFSTITANRDFQTAVHADDGDYRPGLGVMLVIDAGESSGGELVYPAYNTAVDMRPGALLLGDVHEYHANAPIIGSGRLSLVLYFRTKIFRCGSVDEERARAEAAAEK